MALIKTLNNYFNTLLNKLTSYKTVLYFLCTLWISGFVLSITGALTFKTVDLALSVSLLAGVCIGANWIFSKIFGVYTNKDSALISALILALIFNPAKSTHEYIILAVAAAAAMASKYIFTQGNKHLFNPAAFGAFVVATIFNKFPSWWVDNKYLLPVLIIGGILLLVKIKKVRTTTLFFASFVVLLGVGILIAGSSFSSYPTLISQYLTESPLLFFGLVMVTEPLTSPSSQKYAYIYTLIVAILFATPQLRIFKISLEPISALLIGNIFSYAVSPIRRVKLEFVKKVKEADAIYSFLFKPTEELHFVAGQYIELTIPSSKSDSRGNRRYLTISSGPEESLISVSLKIPPKASSFKTYLMNLSPGDHIFAGELSGDFTPEKSNESKFCFIAGGIGVTPFKSVASSALSTKIASDTKLLYFASSPSEFAFNNTFGQAKTYGLKTIYSLTNPAVVPKNWKGSVGVIESEFIKKNIPDFKDRSFYVSGPLGFVQAAESALLKVGINRTQIKTDFFPGY